MQDINFTFVCDLVKKKSGLVLSKDKLYLLESRLAPIARQENLADVDALISKIRSTSDAKLIGGVVEAMTTNESSFFRDTTPFETFKDHVMPHMLKNRSLMHKLRIWCAAASTGQEPYSLSMIMKENPASFGALSVEIMGTDISKQVLDKARAGVYTQFEVQRGMPMQLLVKYFSQEGQNWVLKPEIRGMVQYREFNLLDSFGLFGTWDIVFCRNVLIYFDQPTKTDILKRIAAQLAPDGFLFLGAAETPIGITEKFVPVKGRRGLYQLTTAVAAQAQPKKMAAAG